MRMLCCTFLLILSGCVSQPVVEPRLGNQDYSDEPVGIFIIPVFGAKTSLVAELEKRLQEQHGVRVKTTTEMGLDAKHFDKQHKQFIVEEIAKSGEIIAEKLRASSNSNAPAIIIIPGDMNSADFSLRFLFSKHFFKPRLTVMSLARIDPVSFGEPPNSGLMLDRATKLVNKALGYHLYGYEASSDLGSVMYGPIMGLDDLDSVNQWYK